MKLNNMLCGNITNIKFELPGIFAIFCKAYFKMIFYFSTINGLQAISYLYSGYVKKRIMVINK